MKEKKNVYFKVISAILVAAVFGYVIYSVVSYFSTTSTVNYDGYTYEQVEKATMPYVENADKPINSGYEYLESEKLKSLYKAIEQSVYCISASKDDEGKYVTMQVLAGEERYAEKEIHMTVTAFFDDNPQVFWCDKSLLCSYSKDKGTYISAVSLYSADEIDSMSEKLSKEILKIVSNAPAVSDFYYTEKYVHDRIIDNCEYKTPESSESLASTAYGCLVENKANCEGITDGFNLVMKCFGIETLKIYGSAQGIGLHTWNCVKLNNNWYMTDVTWDMRDKGHRYDYFNMTEKEFSKTHIVEKMYSEIEEDKSSIELSVRYYNIYVPECKDLNQSYFAREGYPVTKETDIYKSKYLLDYMFRAFKSGSGYCCLKISTDIILLDSAAEILLNDENIDYYNTNIQYRLSDGEVFHLEKENIEFVEDLGIIILRF